MKAYSYLALGDSYTIGEGVPLTSNFPYQTVQLLRNKGYDVLPPEIIATTGWTCQELATAFAHSPLERRYDFISLLIGVNNQYRGLPVTAYATAFENLLQAALSLIQGEPRQLIVLSIPDYAYTPFGQLRDASGISREIDLFNQFNAQIARKYQTGYLNITTLTRTWSLASGSVVDDQLHPSALIYEQWSYLLAEKIAACLQPNDQATT